MMTDDRTGAFAPYTLATDLLEIRRIYAGFFASLSEADWQRRTERRPQGWTLRETVAHLDAAAQAYNRFIAAALEDRPATLPGITRRAELSAWNRREIDARAPMGIGAVCDSFLAALYDAAQCAARLTQAALAKRTTTPFYHDQITVAEMLGGQGAHAGLVHAAQVANGAQVAPLWVHFTPALLQRQFTRFFHILGHAYWPERGGSLRASINFIVDGPGGGAWRVTMAPEGAQGRVGASEQAAFTLRFRSAELFCRILTFQSGFAGPILKGQIRVWGNFGLAARFQYLFLPT